MTRKGQITLESLLLYGVAILVVLLAVGALTYFGILDLGRLLPDRCNLASSGTFSCDEWRVDSGGDVQLGLKNIGAQAIEVQNVTFYPDGADRSTPSEYCTNNTETDITTGSLVAFQINCASDVIVQDPGQKIRGDIDIQYKEANGAIVQTVGGQLIATVS